jgi:hypothetical protein
MQTNHAIKSEEQQVQLRNSVSPRNLFHALLILTGLEKHLFSTVKQRLRRATKLTASGRRPTTLAAIPKNSNRPIEVLKFR